MSQEEFSAAFRKLPMKRAKLAPLKRNAAVMLLRDTSRPEPVTAVADPASLSHQLEDA